MARRARLATFGGLAVLGLLAFHNVPDAPTEEDILYADRMLAEAGYTGEKRGFGDVEADFESQLRAIRAAQDTAISIVATDAEVPFDRSREPRDLYDLRRGLCYDRSRLVEKLLGVIGLETRHVSVYSTATRSPLLAVMTPGNDSHALTEVRTAKGWMAVDPNARWIGLTAGGQVLNVGDLRSLGPGTVEWAGDQSARPHAIFSQPYVYVRGLYSRHGRFYPPYTPLPDVNWRQLAQNLFD